MTLPDTTYSYTYRYGTRPHAVVSTGVFTYTYDADGNMITAKSDTLDRRLTWDEEDRLIKTLDNRVETVYAYDDTGTRVLKRGMLGEVVYVNEHYALRNGTQETKQVFAGNTRVATKVSACGKESTYYYHGDHLGSSNTVTTRAGAVHEYLEYFPFGETWIHEKPTSGESVPYKFTSKELDPETGLYYFGARYYEPKLSRWVSADPALKEGKYFPKPNDFDTEHDFFWYVKQDTSGKLPGIGGVFNAHNLDLYSYSIHNPVKIIDPDGKLAFFWHFYLTFSEARNIGFSFWDSLKMAWHAMMWDFRENSQSKTDERMVNSHGMIRNQIRDKNTGEIIKERQKPEDAFKGAERFINEKIDEGTLQSVGEATHTAADNATESHKGQVWTGKVDWDHFKKDTFPSQGVVKEARENIRNVLQKAIEKHPELLKKK